MQVMQIRSRIDLTRWTAAQRVNGRAVERKARIGNRHAIIFDLLTLRGFGMENQRAVARPTRRRGAVEQVNAALAAVDNGLDFANAK